tara:strand:- start:7097 stop:7894 length:798 start_codon:yes stop_codon:yes gene_type:complete
MNHWTQLSIEFANQRNYLDELFKVYPTIPEGLRDIDNNKWDKVEKSFEAKNDTDLLNSLLDLELFPIKDSYIAYMKRDRGSISRNPKTVQRITSSLYDMGLSEIYKKASQPKETNRQIGPMFRNWLRKDVLGAKITTDIKEFLEGKGNMLLDLSDTALASFAEEHLNYDSGDDGDNKGLDLISKFNGKFVVGEAKFLTDFGGHQNAQFNDAIKLVRNQDVKAITVAILDGVPYIESRNQMSRFIRDNDSYNIMSSLVLKEFLYQI